MDQDFIKDVASNSKIYEKILAFIDFMYSYIIPIRAIFIYYLSTVVIK